MDELRRRRNDAAGFFAEARRRGDAADIPWMSRGDAVATPSIFRGGEGRGDAADSVEASRGDAAAAP